MHPDSASELAADTRCYGRSGIRNYVAICVAGRPEPVRSVVMEIGLGSVRVRSRDALPEGEACIVRLGDAGEEPLDVPGVVIYSSPLTESDLHASGIRFLPEGPDQHAAIAAYVRAAFHRKGEWKPGPVLEP